MNGKPGTPSPPPVSVVAIIAVYNEADIFESVVRDLVEQGIQVYVIDDASTDGTLAIARSFLGRGVIGVEEAAVALGGLTPGEFAWERLLLRKAELADQLHADWFIHHDADEFRESPWPGLSLQEAISHVDALGFNAIDSVRLDFWPVDDTFRPGADVREALTYYSAPAQYDRLQIRCWKKTDARVDLASTGGHEVRFVGRRVFPHRFILKHYPVRSQAHGERKVFAERRPRFAPHERARGWHVQYDCAVEGQSFIRQSESLARYDADALYLALALTRGTADETERLLNAAYSDLAAARETSRTLREEVGTADQRRTEVDAEASRLRAENEQLTERLHQAARDVDGLHELLETGRAQSAVALAEVLRQLKDIHESLSWRWTAPVRRALERLGYSRGRRG